MVALLVAPTRTGLRALSIAVDETIGYEHAAPELAVRGGLTRRMVVASGLLALVVATAFGVLLSSVAVPAAPPFL